MMVTRALPGLLAVLMASACGGEKGGTAPAALSTEGAVIDEGLAALGEPPTSLAVTSPSVNARRGRILFITKGCVICHQVNGVGGKAAPDLSTDRRAHTVNPLEFSARMWRGAPAMTALQAIELGYVIDLDAQDIADLAAFAGSLDEQQLLTLSSVGVEMRSWFLDEPHWRSGDWTEYLKRGDAIPGVGEETPEGD